MNYNSVSEIFDEIDGTRARLLQVVGEFDDEQHAFRPAPDRWSVAQLCDHLSKVEAQVVGLIGRVLAKAEESGAARAAGAPFAPVSIEEFVEKARGVKLNAPEAVHPEEARPLAESLAALRDTRDALRSLRPRLEQVDGHAARFPHPSAGPLNLYQWLLFIGSHEARHVAQIEALKEAINSAPAGNS